MGILISYEKIQNDINNDDSGSILITSKEEFESEIKIQHKSNTKVKLLIKCGCGENTFNTSYNQFLNKVYPRKYCDSCTAIYKKDKLTKTHVEFINEAQERVGNEYAVLGTYDNAKSKILFRHNCEACNNFEFEMLPNGFLGTPNSKGKRCPKCFGKPQKTTEEFIKDFRKLKQSIDYEILGDYKTSKDKILTKHLVCNNQWNANPTSLLAGIGCPKCFGTPKKTHEQFAQEVHNLVGNEYLILGRYEKRNQKILIKHNSSKCDHEFLMRPYAFLYSNQRCPKCSLSKGEESISDYLNNKNIKYEIEYSFKNCKYKNVLPFDFVLFGNDNNPILAIEYQGEHHYKPIDFAGKGRLWASEKFKETQIRDKIKLEYCSQNNIKLLEIKYSDFNSIEEILENKLKELNISTKTINNISNT